MRTPPTMSGRPRSMRCVSQPCPMRNGGGLSSAIRAKIETRRLQREIQLSQLHIAGFSDLYIAIRTQHHGNFHLFQPLDERGLIRSDKQIFPRLLKSLAQQVETKHLWRLREDQALSWQRGTDLVAMHLLDRVDGHNAEDGGARLASFLNHFLDNFSFDKRANCIVDGH